MAVPSPRARQEPPRRSGVLSRATGPGRLTNEVARPQELLHARPSIGPAGLRPSDAAPFEPSVPEVTAPPPVGGPGQAGRLLDSHHEGTQASKSAGFDSPD